MHVTQYAVTNMTLSLGAVALDAAMYQPAAPEPHGKLVKVQIALTHL